MKYEMKRAIHIDFHTMPGVTDFGADFDAAAFAQRLADAGVKYVNVFAKCNTGFAYFPTKIGIPYPHMKGDMFGDTLRECHKRGIGVTAYFNGGLDHEQALRHRDWLLENKDGQIQYGDRTGNFFRMMCFNTGYSDYMLALIGELLEKYPEVDGVFIDCMLDFYACHGHECRLKAIEMGLDPLSDADLMKVREDAGLRFMKNLKGIVGDRYLRINGYRHWDTHEINTHAEIECIPGGWSYDCFPGQVAYLRNVYDKVLYMTGRFQHSWADFGGLRSKASLENDIWDAHCNAAGVMIGDHMHPSRNIEPAVYDMVKDLYKDVIALEPWTDGAKYQADIAVVIKPNTTAYEPEQAGAIRMLSELKLGVDFVNEYMDLSKYKLLIVPTIRFSENLAAKVRAHLDAGKGVITTGFGGMAPAGAAREHLLAQYLTEEERAALPTASAEGFVLPEWQFLTYDGPESTKTGYLRINDGARAAHAELAALPELEMSLYGNGILCYANGGEVLADFVPGYFDQINDGSHSLFYCPPNKPDGHAALARNGKVFHFSFPVFRSYDKAALPGHKQLVKYAIDQLLPENDRSFKQQGLPSFARLTLTRKDGMYIAHIKATHPEPRGQMDIIEEHTYLPAGAEIAVKGTFTKVYTAPDRTPLPFTCKDGFTHVILPEIRGYLPVAFE